jgi:hypothetical protein
LNKTTEELRKFWSEIAGIFDKSNDKVMLQQIARLKYFLRRDPELASWFNVELRVFSATLSIPKILFFIYYLA